jgi:thiosulfate dehydrogenase
MIPDDSLGAAIRRGQAILRDTRDSLPAYATSSLNCTSCHLGDGRQAGAAPLIGVVARFPKYLGRAGAVIPVEDRINYCFTRSLAGRRLPNHSREMQDIVAYLAFLSQGLPVGTVPDGLGIPAIPVLEGDSARGHQLYGETCAACHGADGEGGAAPRAPALWGPESFSIGASMARIERAASFVRHKMPFNEPGTLTDQQAWDVAAYLDRQPRPDMPGKEEDWPNGGAPAGVPYATAGRQPAEERVLLSRPDPEGSLVPVPERAGGRGP